MFMSCSALMKSNNSLDESVCVCVCVCACVCMGMSVVEINSIFDKEYTKLTNTHAIMNTNV